jgi:hypothetical protein
MTALFRWGGVDYRQWRAVSRTLLRGDFRAPMPQAAESYSIASVSGFAMMALVFGLFGVGPAVLVALSPHVLLTGTITLTYFAFALSTVLLTQHGATMLSPADHVILGPRPVSSRTFFAIRLTNVVFHALLITTFMAYPAILAFTFAHGRDVGRGLGAATAIYAWSLAVASAVVASYAALLRLVSAGRLQRLVAWAQLLAGFVSYGAFFLLIEGLRGTAIARATLPDDAWVWWLPPAWFASVIALSAGQTDALMLTRAALALVAMILLAALLAGRLASDYATHVAELTAVASLPSASRRRAPILFTRGESRAVALLAAAHFRHDLRVRMGLFAIVPLVMLDLVIGMREGAAADPFAGGGAEGPAANLLSLTALLLPALIIRQLEASDAHRASWIYHATPADRGRLVVALKNVAVVYFLLPLGALLAAVFAWRFAHAGHALVHAAVLTAVGHLALQTAMLLQPRLPFARPPEKLGQGALFAWLAGVLIGGQLLLIWLQHTIYVSWPRVVVAFAAILAASCLVECGLRRRARS